MKGAPVRVKVCGITRLEDALAAVDAGADALGFNFWPRSKRFCPPDRAAELLRALPPFVVAVGVFVNPTRTGVARAVRESGVQVVQLHGDESPEFCASLPFPLLKALPATEAPLRRTMAAYRVGAFLVDTPTREYGGSGRTFDWRLLRGVDRTRLVLAGGLTPENVAEAVRAVRPLGVDVASGVEKSPGIKDARKLRRFLAAAKSAR